MSNGQIAIAFLALACLAVLAIGLSWLIKPRTDDEDPEL